MKTIISNSVLKQSLCAATTIGLFIASVLASPDVFASKFGVRVIDDKGNPVSGASVCFGLPGNYSQFGSSFTDSDGNALSEVPNVPFVVTVSKTRFSGMRINEPARNFNLIKQVTLSDGVPGPRCRAGSTLAESNQSAVMIADVAIDAVPGRSVVLTPKASGEPTEYRLSTNPDIASTDWLVLDKNIVLGNSFANSDEVYLQLRRFEGIRNGWISAVSDVVKVYLPVTR
ncbi:MAG: Ig-like domain-containing protein [Granulosicoccus sp.]|nr:Ig-like domain-containing protein [Granulosicoccus sp.]